MMNLIYCNTVIVMSVLYKLAEYFTKLLLECCVLLPIKLTFLMTTEALIHGVV